MLLVVCMINFVLKVHERIVFCNSSTRMELELATNNMKNFTILPYNLI
jgi:hypothetical protein